MNEAAVAEGTPVPAESEPAEVEVTDEPKEATTEPTEAEAEGEQPTGEDQPKEDETQQKRNRVQERIKTLTDRAKEAEAKAKELEDRVKFYEGKAPQAEPNPMPTLEQFDYDQNAYSQAMVQWTNEQAQAQIANQMTEQQRWQAEQARQQAHQESMKAYQERQAAFEMDHPDFRQTVANYQFQTQHVAEAIVNSENGPAIAYHLAQNPGIAQAIEGANPVQALMELGRIEARLSSPPPVNTSNTPPPATPVAPTGKAEKSPEDMSPKEYANWRNKQLGLA